MFSQCWVSCQISEKVLQEHLNFGLFVFDLFSCIRLASLRFTIFSVRFYLIFQLASGRIENRPERVTLVTGPCIEPLTEIAANATKGFLHPLDSNCK